MPGNFGILFLIAGIAFAFPLNRESYELLGVRRTSEQNQASAYFFSGAEGTYDDGFHSCLRVFNASLVALETKDEENFLVEHILDYFNYGNITYWMGGKWAGNSSFIWENGMAFRNDSIWGSGEPRLRNDNVRVAIDLFNSTRVTFVTNEANFTIRHICEVHM